MVVGFGLGVDWPKGFELPAMQTVLLLNPLAQLVGWSKREDAVSPPGFGDGPPISGKLVCAWLPSACVCLSLFREGVGRAGDGPVVAQGLGL